MIVLLFGPPGSGKGTQARLIAENLGIPAISTGEMFRAECKAGTPLGKLACAILKDGGLVDDGIVDRMVAARIAQPDCAPGFLLDGYPRTLPQARFFDRLIEVRNLSAPVSILLDVPASVIVDRITSRRQCAVCGRIYNLASQPPAQEGICDFDGGALTCRDDDTEPVVLDRLRAYEESTGPAVAYYCRAGGHRVDGTRTPEQIALQISELLRHTATKVVAGTRA